MADNALPFAVENLESVPEKFRGFYTQGANGFELNPQEAVNLEMEKKYKDKINEFRDRSSALAKEKDAIQAKLEPFNQLNMSADQIQALKMQMSEFTAREALEKNNLEQFVAERTQEMKAVYEKEKNELVKKFNAVSEQANKYKDMHRLEALRNLINEKASTAHPIRETARDDLMSRARGVWAMDDESGQLYAKDSNGDPMFGVKSGERITMEEWLEKMTDVAPHLFVTGSAGGVQQANPMMQNDFQAGQGVQGSGERRWIDATNPILMGQYAAEISRGEIEARMPA